jgi:hypothetical protein
MTTRAVRIITLTSSYLVAFFLLVVSQVHLVPIFRTEYVFVYAIWVVLVLRYVLICLRQRIWLFFAAPQLVMLLLPIYEFSTQSGCPHKYSYCVY